MKFFVVDTTVNQGGKNPVVLFDTTDGVINYLEKMCVRKFGQNRKQFMFESESLGFSQDDSHGIAFFEMMEQYFHVGVIRGDSTPIRCNIFEAHRFSKTRDVHGN